MGEPLFNQVYGMVKKQSESVCKRERKNFRPRLVANSGHRSRLQNGDRGEIDAQLAVVLQKFNNSSMF